MADRSPARVKIAGEDRSSDTEKEEMWREAANPVDPLFGSNARAAAVHAKIIGAPKCGAVIYIYIRRGAAIYPGSGAPHGSREALQARRLPCIIGRRAGPVATTV
ncbi:hypothetical protein MRX96_010812 [Rhipicephalus microplus]